MFFKVRGEFGAPSNMADGFPPEACRARGAFFGALYQAQRFSEYPEIQREIIAQRKGMCGQD